MRSIRGSARALVAGIAAVIGSMAISPLAAYAGQITVYTALEEDEIAEYIKKAKADLPDIDVKVLRLSTGDLGARIMAEADNPRHDVIWGWAVTNIMAPRMLATLEPYEPKGADKLPQAYRSPDKKWFAATGYIGAFCVNQERVKQRNLPMPKSWADLLNPAYKGEIVMPNPVSSGTGYLQIVSLLQKMGDEKGWAFLKQLDGNVNQYIKSGSRPCKAARQGEFAIGTSLAFAAIKSIEEGFPLTMVLPSEGSGYEIEASALVKGSKNAADAKRFLDWTLSPGVSQLYASFKELVTTPDFKPSKTARDAGMPEDPAKILFPMDFAKAAAERDAILARWQKEIGR